MRLFKTFAVFSLTLGIAGCTFTQQKTLSHSDYIERMATASAVSWPELATLEEMKEQTGFFADLQVLVYDGVNAWLVDAKGYRAIAPEPVEALGLPSDFGKYEKLSWNGRPTVYMGIGTALPEVEMQKLITQPAAVPELFLLATHEAFHFYGQQNWPMNDGSRAERFPIQIPPRQYRKHLIEALHAAVRGGVEELGKARYWYDRWRTEYAREAVEIHDNDIIEGSAKYVEVLAEMVATGAVDQSQAWNTAVMARSPNAADTPADGESYLIGALAGYLLDRQGTQWWQRVTQGDTPLQLLLEPMAAIVDIPDPELNQRITQALNDRNQSLETIIGPFIGQLRHPDTVRLLVPSVSAAGSLSTSGLYRVEDLSGEILTHYSQQFSPAMGRITMDNVVAAAIISESCGEIGGFIMVPITARELAEARAERLRINREGVEIDVPFPVKGAGNDWCVRDKVTT
ncbi:hypothetical protein [Pseudomonas sp. Irchel 3A7]|uniref:hypothetical protein n=1 Tax=Pseudomonas sp. Irchel 3A7 TaxID=2008913 RepID=UPI000BA456E4|nr:hypothetical protein [Pseudomonas sp. Irchel 3A7]